MPTSLIRRSLAFVLGVSLTLLSLTPLGGDEPPPQPHAAVRPGMTADEVRALFKQAPKRVSRQILYRRCVEVWTYELPSSLQIEFNCVRGQDPRVVGVYPLPVIKP